MHMCGQVYHCFIGWKKQNKTRDPSRTHTQLHVCLCIQTYRCILTHTSAVTQMSTQTVFDNNANSHLHKWRRYSKVDLCSFMGEQEEK